MSNPFEVHKNLTIPQQVGDFDLTKAVRDVLVRVGVSPLQLNCFDTNLDIQLSQGKAPDAQLFLHKRFWIHQLLSLTQINTMEDRLLIHQFNVPKDWFTYFANNVVDLIMIHNIPKQNGW